jgi:hypothetical protein
MTGTCMAGYTTSQNLNYLNGTVFPKQLLTCNANGLIAEQYEGGGNFYGDAFISGFGGSPQFTDFTISYGRSANVAAIFAASYGTWAGFGGCPSKWPFEAR